MQEQNFDVDIKIPSSKQNVKINAEFIEVGNTRVACENVKAIKYGVSLVGTVKKPVKKKYNIDVMGNDGKVLNINFESSKVTALLEEDHTYLYIMSGLAHHVKNQLFDKFLGQINAKETIQVGHTDLDFNGIPMNYKTWFFGKTKQEIVPWQQIGFDIDKGFLNLKDNHDSRKKIAFSLHNDWNAVILNTFLTYLEKDKRKEKLAKGEEI